MNAQRKSWFCQDCRVTMIYDKKNDRHICPTCKTMVNYHDENDFYLNDEIGSLMRDMAATHRQLEVKPLCGAIVPGGGSKSKGRSRDSDMKKKSLAQINAGLNGKAMAFESR